MKNSDYLKIYENYLKANDLVSDIETISLGEIKSFVDQTLTKEQIEEFLK